MRVETVEQLCCPASHAPSPLITVAFERDGDWLIDGLLGCSVCGAEYPMTDGVVHFGGGRHAAVVRPERETSTLNAPTDPLRVAALLGLSEPGMRVVLCGDCADCAKVLTQVTGAHCVVVNANSGTTHGRDTDRLTMPVDATLPFGSGAMHGMAIDVTHVPLLHRAAFVVRAGGRVLAPADAPVPHGLRELARDAHNWVAQVEASAGSLVSLRARHRPPAPG